MPSTRVTSTPEAATRAHDGASRQNADAALLEIDGLHIRTRDGQPLVHDLSLTLHAGEWLAVVGESGSGKSLSALACLRLLPPALVASGDIRFAGESLAGMSRKRLLRLRGGDVGMVYQEPLTALNPLHRIGKQLVEAIRLHQPVGDAQARKQALALLREVGIPEPERRLQAWPHELSGGQRQRVVIAMALANRPRLLIADEPTTALDALLQTQILDLLRQLQRSRGLAVLHISHDLPQVRRYADRVAVMRAGRLVEQAETATLFATPAEDYTRTLLQPLQDQAPATLPEASAALLTVSRLGVRYPRQSNWLGRVTDWHQAVRDLGLTLRKGEALGIVGESGSGKSSLAAALLRLVPAEGRAVLLGRDWLSLRGEPLRQARRHVQMVFQDPYGSLSPRLTVGDLIAEGLHAHQSLSAADSDRAVVEALRAVKLDPETRHRYPHEFSGGQRQRIALARALILRPALIVLDEPTSALDRHTQGEVVRLLRDIQQQTGIGYLFISHDLAVVRALCHRVLVLHDGRVVEQGDSARVFASPQHAYTRALLSALPT
ncbi:ABC transporter ATP-binding protein [Amnimonas aquatica]|uniref:ABC-type dipeptide transporter n=2 Tax=Gammaproteobacteria TaxID=1236 RepID=A0A2P6AUS6_9GAMM|nr:dipeptide ABC transporter ATP-binding protein [Amnimonas aquatica]PQA51046.1 microcin ABC transporter ATP-binding protein [Amnimonas aquatica]